MSGVLQGPVGYLVDDEAKDVSTLTGIPWSYQRVHQRGTLRPFLDLRDLDWWDRFRVAFAMIAAHAYMDSVDQTATA